MLLLALVAACRAGFVEFPREVAEELSVDRFEAEFVERWRPVVIRPRRAAAASWGLAELTARCGDGALDRFETGSGWAGFDVAGARKVSLRDLVGEMARTPSAALYGFNMDAKCACPGLVEATTLPPYFKGDVLPRRDLVASAFPFVIVGSRAGKG